MTETIGFIPIKKISKRLPEKNFKSFCGHPLYQYIIINALSSGAFDRLYVDTDSDEIKEFAKKKGFQIIDRPEYMTYDNVNGNDLLIYDYNQIQQGDYLFQLFATAPLLKSDTIRKCVDFLKNNNEYDSIFTATEEKGWYWFSNVPVNYRPSILPRSQDAEFLIKETTGCYGITVESLMKYKCRIGAKPKLLIIDRMEAMDIDTPEDFELAEKIGYMLHVDKLILNE